MSTPNPKNIPGTENMCPINTRIPGKVGIGPVMTYAQLLATYPKDNPAYRPMPDGSKTPVLGGQEWLENPTPEAIYERCTELMDAADKETEKAKDLEGGQKEKGKAV